MHTHNSERIPTENINCISSVHTETLHGKSRKVLNKWAIRYSENEERLSDSVHNFMAAELLYN